MPTAKRPQAIKTSPQEAALRKVERMFEGHGKELKRRAEADAKPQKQMAIRNTDVRRRKTDTQASRMSKLKLHFKNITSGKVLQGKK